MNQTNLVLAQMEKLKVLLEKEKNVLISNDGSKLNEIIQEKEDIMLTLAAFDQEDVEMNKLDVLSREIKQLQETNLILTEQSIQFTETMLNYIKKAANQNKTYSKKGTYEDSKKSTLLDQSL
ncbi:flagellar export chaperone FlgN [Alkalibacterium sp. f15]|uniref:flagellar export chaperone FlgN n=1 Tax=Alkalibacterium sp. f15 TaxID=3414029 RepID=UPI003BF7BF3C